MGFAHRAFVAAGVGFAASVIVGCGSSGSSLLSGTQANSLTALLNRASDALDSQNCAQAQQYLQDFQTSVENMGGVNPTLVNDLSQGVITVESLANRECRTVTTPVKTHTRTQPTTTTTATQTTQTFTSPTTTYTQPTYTQPPATTTTETTTAPNTTGGGCVNCLPTTTTSSSTTPTTPTDTNPSGGGGLGGPDTTATTDSTTSTDGTGF